MMEHGEVGWRDGGMLLFIPFHKNTSESVSDFPMTLAEQGSSSQVGGALEPRSWEGVSHERKAPVRFMGNWKA